MNNQNSERKSWGDYDSEDDVLRTPLRREVKERHCKNENKDEHNRYRTKQEHEIQEKGSLLNK